MSGSNTLYVFRIEVAPNMEGDISIVSYTVEDALKTVKQYLPDDAIVKLVRKDKISFGDEWKEINGGEGK